MEKALLPRVVAELVQDGARIMLGRFIRGGRQHRTSKARVASGRRDLRLIANDTGMHDRRIRKPVTARRGMRLIGPHIGLNREMQEPMNDGNCEGELMPQDALIEGICAGGMGLGGAVTPTGQGAGLKECERRREIKGKRCLLEVPVRVDFAFITARHSDYLGTPEYSLTARSCVPIMAMAVEAAIAEPEPIIPVGGISRDAVRTPAIRVDHLIQRPHEMTRKERIACRSAQEIAPGTLVKLWNRRPGPVAGCVPAQVEVLFQSESAAIGLGAGPPEGMDDPDLTVLDGLQVDKTGTPANWMVHGKMVPKLGRRVLDAMQRMANGVNMVIRA
ncbi:MAG: 3-oxoacid CoA-transferase subunit A [Roseobacter sp.]